MCHCCSGARIPGGRSTRYPRSPDRYKSEEALSFCTHQDPCWKLKLPARRDSPRSGGSTTVDAGARPKVNISPGRSRHVRVSYITISSTAAAYLQRHRRFAVISTSTLSAARDRSARTRLNPALTLSKEHRRRLRP
jgi:hypothetical protein